MNLKINLERQEILTMIISIVVVMNIIITKIREVNLELEKVQGKPL